MERVVMLLTTVDDEAVARSLAQGLVAQRLAACVQLSSPVTSFYHWQGALEQSREYRLEIKTVPSQCRGALAWLQAHHPYQTPEILQLEASASADYAAWMRLEQRGASG